MFMFKTSVKILCCLVKQKQLWVMIMVYRLSTVFLRDPLQILQKIGSFENLDVADFCLDAIQWLGPFLTQKYGYRIKDPFFWEEQIFWKHRWFQKQLHWQKRYLCHLGFDFYPKKYLYFWITQILNLIFVFLSFVYFNHFLPAITSFFVFFDASYKVVKSHNLFCLFHGKKSTFQNFFN